MLKEEFANLKTHKLSSIGQRKERAETERKRKEEEHFLVLVAYIICNFLILYLFKRGHICYLEVKFPFLNKQHNVPNLLKKNL